MASVTKGYENLPRFPDGRINYTDSDSAPTIACLIEQEGKILLVRRSNDVDNYKGKWDVITGFIDNPNISTLDHALLEIEEEIGLTQDELLEVDIRKPYKYNNKFLKKTWMIFPVLVRLKSDPNIKLNNENTEFKWIDPKDAHNYDTVPDFEKFLQHIL